MRHAVEKRAPMIRRREEHGDDPASVRRQIFERPGGDLKCATARAPIGCTVTYRKRLKGVFDSSRPYRSRTWPGRRLVGLRDPCTFVLWKEHL